MKDYIILWWKNLGFSQVGVVVIVLVTFFVTLYVTDNSVKSFRVASLALLIVIFLIFFARTFISLLSTIFFSIKIPDIDTHLVFITFTWFFAHLACFCAYDIVINNISSVFLCVLLSLGFFGFAVFYFQNFGIKKKVTVTYAVEFLLIFIPMLVFLKT